MTLPSRGPYSPWSSGPRTVVARTCLGCGRLADGASFPLSGRTGARRHVCHDCFNARKKRDREQRGIGVPAPRPPEDLQTARWTRWSQADDTFLRENVGVLTYEQIAVALGRSLAAVYKRRDVLGLATVRTRRRVNRPWLIR